MNTVYVSHPDPALNLPTRKLYSYKQTATGFSAPHHSTCNITFTDPIDMFKYALDIASCKQGKFVVVAWGLINGKPIDTIGYLCFDKGVYKFTPVACSEYAQIKNDHSSFLHQMNKDSTEDPVMLEVSRGWFMVEQGSGESIDDPLLQRVAKVFAHALYRNPITMEKLYDIAINFN